MPESILLTGIPFDQKSSYLQGSRFAPAMIREELRSTAYNAFSEDLSDIMSAGLVIQDDVACASYEALMHNLTTTTDWRSRHLFLGGDHSVSYPVVRALRQHISPFHILHFDAHGDLYDNFEGDRFSHACPFARIMDEGLALSLTQVGIRAPTPHQRSQVESFGVKVYSIHALKEFQPASLEGPLYVSIDMDALDPSCAPGVSHREAGGLSVRQLITFLQQIRVPIIGADLVEYNPLQDASRTTVAVAAKIVREVVAAMLRNPENR